MVEVRIHLGGHFSSRGLREWLVQRLSAIVWPSPSAIFPLPTLPKDSVYEWDLGGNDWWASIEDDTLCFAYRDAGGRNLSAFYGLVRFLLWSLNLEEENQTLLSSLEFNPDRTD